MRDEINYSLATKLYKDIIYSSEHGKKRGMRIGDILKKYDRIELRDIKTLIKFLIRLDEYEERSIRHIVYTVTEEQREKDKEELMDYYDIDMIEDDLEHINKDYYIRIEDSVHVLYNKIGEEQIDILNAELLKKIRQDSSFCKIWHQVSNVSLDHAYIIDKGDNWEENQRLEKIKREWIHAIVHSNLVQILEQGKSKERKLFPRGLYYDAFLGYYKCIYMDSKGSENDIPLSDIVRLKIVDEWLENSEDEKGFRSQFLDVREYMQSKQKEKITIKVYRKEANVLEKIKRLLSDNQCEFTEKDEYVLISFLTDDPEEYMMKLNSYGRSVIILEPSGLHDEALEIVNNTLEKYELLKSYYPDT